MPLYTLLKIKLINFSLSVSCCCCDFFVSFLPALLLVLLRLCERAMIMKAYEA
jgi:hypothetical protein